MTLTKCAVIHVVESGFFVLSVRTVTFVVPILRILGIRLLVAGILQIEVYTSAGLCRSLTNNIMLNRVPCRSILINQYKIIIK